MMRLFQGAALLIAIGGAAWFIYTAQHGIEVQAQPVQQAATPSDAGSAAASAASASSAGQPDAGVKANRKPPEMRRPLMGGSKAFAPSDGVFLGGSKAAPIILGEEQNYGGIGRAQGRAITSDAAKEKAAKEKAAKEKAAKEKAAKEKAAKEKAAQGDAVPQQAPRRFMGSSKFDASALPLPERPKQQATPTE